MCCLPHYYNSLTICIHEGHSVIILVVQAFSSLLASIELLKYSFIKAKTRFLPVSIETNASQLQHWRSNSAPGYPPAVLYRDITTALSLKETAHYRPPIQTHCHRTSRKILHATYRDVFAILSYQLHGISIFVLSIERPTAPTLISVPPNVHPTPLHCHGYGSPSPSGCPSINRGSNYTTTERPAGTKQLKRHSQPTSLAPHYPYKQATPPAAPLQHPHPINKLQLVPYHDYHHQFH